MLAYANVSIHPDTSSTDDYGGADVFCGNCTELAPETDQPLPESTTPLFRSGSQQKEQEETKSIMLFVQDHLANCISSTCLYEFLTPVEIEDCDYVRLMRYIRNSRRFVTSSFNDEKEAVGNTVDDYLRALLRG
jgi:hypothetical protein